MAAKLDDLRGKVLNGAAVEARHDIACIDESILELSDPQLVRFSQWHRFRQSHHYQSARRCVDQAAQAYRLLGERWRQHQQAGFANSGQLPQQSGPAELRH